MAIEDFTTYTEVDGGGDLTVTASKIDVVTQAANVTNYVYKAKNISTADFDWDFEVETTAATGVSTPSWFNIGVSTSIGALSAGTSLVTYMEGENLTPYVADIDGSGNFDAFSGGASLSLSTLYYCSISRVGSAVTWDIYSNSARTTLVQSLSTTIINTTASYQYAYGQSASNFGPADTSTYYIQNLDFKEAAGGFQSAWAINRTAAIGVR